MEKPVGFDPEAADQPANEAAAQVKGPECPTCGDRFPSKEALAEHQGQAH